MHLRKAGVRWFVGFVFAAWAQAVIRAEVTLAPLFSDRAVLQQGVALPIWGWAEPGERVTVSLAGQVKQTQAAADGAWRVLLDPLQPGEALTLTVQGSTLCTVRDILVGEVWLGSGQSNMAMTVNRCQEYEQEKAAAVFPQIRMFTVTREVATEPQRRCKGEWVVCSPETVGGFSGTAYFFGREIHRRLGVPVGLINSSWGGTPIESWTRAAAQAAVPELAPVLDPWTARTAQPWDEETEMAAFAKQSAAWRERAKKAKEAGTPAPRAPRKPVAPRLDPHHPANLYNGMIAPLAPYALRGALWYQGESNARDASAHLYGTQLQLLVEDWRSQWGTALPFAWVQLPNFRASDRNWPLVREGMAHALRLPATGMAITMDIGERDDIHPRNKQEVGRRLSLWALGTVYGQAVDAVSGPLLAGHTLRDRVIVCSFRHTAGGLVAAGGALQGFVIAGTDQAWKPAEARIEGDTVHVSHPEIAQPVAVRYAWAADPVCNLFNAAGLPASPFRTDTFPFPLAP